MQAPRAAAWTAVAALALVAAALAACGGGGEASPADAEAVTGGVAGVQTAQSPEAKEPPTQEPTGFATPAELRWLRALAAWNRSLMDAATRVGALEEDEQRFGAVLRGEDAARREYGRLLRPIRECGASLERRVPAAPTERLRAAREGYRAGCEHYAKAIDLLLRGIDEEDDGLVQRAQYRVIEARKEMQVADGTLPPGEKQELPEREGAVAASRIEPRFGGAASEAVGKEVEARCWSKGDWKKLVAEERIHTFGRIDERVLGFASAGGRRIHLAPSMCEQLVRLVYEGARPQAAEAKLDLALGLVTLVHEGVHASGVGDEPTAECHAIQLVDEAGAALGVEDGYVAQLKAAYWQVYPSLPAEYRSDECRRGGELDLGGDGAFP